MSNWYVCTDTGTVLSAAEYQTVSHNTAHYIILGDYPNKASALAAVPRALDRHFAAKEVQDYLSAGKQQGVPLSALPELLSSYRHLSDTAQRMLLDSAYITKYASVESSQTLGSWMDEERQSADICLIDNSGSRHYLDAVLYLHSEDRADPAFQYTPLETWLRTLPLSRVECLDDHALAVVYSGFSTDQMTFLLGEAQNNLDSLNWCNQYDRASYANAGSAARLAYLQAQTPFESPFDGDCMDVSDPAERKHLCEFLKAHQDVFVYQPYMHDPTAFIAYAVEYDENDRVSFIDFDTTIHRTAAGKGLSSTIDGKLFYAEHKLRTPDSHEKEAER